MIQIFDLSLHCDSKVSILFHSIMVITPDFGSSNVGSIPAGTTVMSHWCNGLAQNSSKVLVKVRVLNGVLLKVDFFLFHDF